MKKLLGLFAFFTVILISKPALAADIPVYIDSINLEFTDATPQTVNDRVMVPMRIIFEKLGADVQWNEETQTATAKKSDSVVALTIDNAIAKLNGSDKKLDTPAVKISDRTYVPIRFVSESLGAKVYWNEEKNTVYIYSKDYLLNITAQKLRTIIKHKYGDIFNTSLGEIGIAVTALDNGSNTNYLYDYYIVSGINQFSVENILENESYTQAQKSQFKEEIRQYIYDMATYINDVTLNRYKIAGAYVFVDGYKEKGTKNEEPIFKSFYSWTNYDYIQNKMDNKGIRWAPENDDYKLP